MNEPPSRKQRFPLPESAPVIDEARKRRIAYLRAMEITTQSCHSEHEREARDDDNPYLTDDEDEE